VTQIDVCSHDITPYLRRDRYRLLAREQGLLFDVRGKAGHLGDLLV